MYHVAGPEWREGALYCWDILQELGVPVRWKWSSEPGEYDSDIVCLFDSLAEAEQFAAEFGGAVLRVEVPEHVLAGETYSWYDPRVGRYLHSRLGGPNAEGYHYITDAVPAEWLVHEGVCRK